MTILVTGGSGYIGSVTVKQLLNHGYDVMIFDNVERGHRDAIDSRASLVEGDLLDFATIQKVIRDVQPAAVMHFAAFALVGESMSEPMMYYRNNVSGGINLLNAMLACGCRRIVFSSTCATYGVPPTLPIVEDMPQQPTNPYGHSKLIFEQILEWHRLIKGLSPVCLRYFNACGAVADLGEDHDPETHLIPNVLKVALGQRPYLDVYGNDYPTQDGTCVRDYVHVSDLARAHVLALNSDATGAINLGTGEGVSVLQVVEVCRRVTGHSIPVRFSPRRQGDPPALYASGCKAKAVLGWVPEVSSIGKIVEDAWAWHLTHPNGYS